MNRTTNLMVNENGSMTVMFRFIFDPNFNFLGFESAVFDLDSTAADASLRVDESMVVDVLTLLWSFSFGLTDFFTLDLETKDLFLPTPCIIFLDGSPNNHPLTIHRQIS